ncbi:MAG: hypothetical protein K2X94_03150 [Amoebophilaceae bacterium]|nr:hypothetical protein [Amoebophilaceae bacterium]
MNNFKIKLSHLKTFLFVLLFGMVHIPSYAMVPQEQKMKFGVKVDSSLALPNFSKQHIRSGNEASLTLFFEWKFANWFGLRSGIGYAGLSVIDISVKNGSLKDTAYGATNHRGLQLNKVGIPLVARFYPGENEKFCLYIGPLLGWIVGGKEVVLPDVSTQPSIFDLEIIKKIVKDNQGSDLPKSDKKFALSYDFGFDYETNFGLTIGMEGLGFSLGYNFSSLL